MCHISAAVCMQKHVDIGAETGQRLVDGVVHDLIYQMVQTAAGGGADIHTGALADSLQAFQNLDLLRTVFLCYFHFIRHSILQGN